MGSLFSSNSASQATTNSQVGAQGGSGTTATVGSGNQGTVAGGNNSTAIGPLSASGSINITTSDVEALHTVDNTVHDALEANQAVSTDSVNAANQVAINALSTVEAVAGQNAATTNNAVQTAQAIAGQAAPVSEGNLALGLTNQGSTTKQIEVGVAIAAVTGLLFYLVKGHKA